MLHISSVYFSICLYDIIDFLYRESLLPLQFLNTEITTAKITQKMPDKTTICFIRHFYDHLIYLLPSPAKYSLVSFTTVPDNRKTAIRFGMDIKPLNVSAILHNSPRSTVAPRIATNA